MSCRSLTMSTKTIYQSTIYEDDIPSGEALGDPRREVMCHI